MGFIVERAPFKSSRAFAQLSNKRLSLEQSKFGTLLRANDDWDVYYERGRKPKESIIKYEAARSECDYRRKVRGVMREARETFITELVERETFILSF